ncbi:WD40/YVTN/BNR-like repeat-containing protein [Sungkyunkwania multivorans]|uniref:WD40/YVTN/BNR-like repeat-containing protein n=1 Tax=Sungkyunkwania multivorans TaxID=1173618 RepID=A0ABW3D2T1_9FLAO
MKRLSLVALILFSFVNLKAQSPATPASDVQKALEQKAQLEASSIVKNIPFENIGPTVMSGRIVDLAVNPDNPVEFYAAYASGGLWYTKNNGTSFEPVLDSSPTNNVGDIAVDWTRGTIWVGTGENNSSRSSYAGIGILKSTDKGKTWQNMGLHDSHHIGRIVINPKNPDEVVVAVVGHLYSPNQERGVFKTTDGGKTWKKTLFVSPEAGIIDLAVSPNNFDIQFAASWEKDRKAWNFLGNGDASAIYKSTDAGETWSKVTTKRSGFPTGEGVGRIGLAVFDDNIIYAVHDNQFRRAPEKEEKKKSDLEKEDFKSMSVQDFLALEDKKLNKFLKTNGFQEKYRAENVKQMIRSGVVKPADIAKYLESANTNLFDTPVIGAEVYRSEDGGKSWKIMNEEYIDDVFYSYGYYFAQIRVNPKNKEKVYIAGVPILKSENGGKTWESINRENVHADHHALWINPKMPSHLINGNDGGVNISYDDGETWVKNNSPSVGQFYAINVDNQQPYHVYGGLQDNGVWVGAHNAREDRSWHQSGQYPWKSIMGGDGMQIEIDSRNPDIVYTGYQFGNYFRLNRKDGDRVYIQPKHELGEAPYRFNWQTPILLSPHNQDILYLGGNKLHRSLNQGDDWEAISDDLTKGAKEGNVAYGTLTTISESPFKFGLIYVGSDDGLVHATKNAGGSWERVSNSFPQDLWVSRVVASSHKKERVYVSLNGYRWDDFTPYVYMSDNYGKTWKNISSNLPLSPVNVIKEDPENEDLLFVGTDNGTYVSFDRGNSWEAFSKGLTPAAVHDIVIQPEAKDLLVGTHGRSIFKANIAPLQELNVDLRNKTLHLFAVESIRHSGNWGSSWSKWLEPRIPSMDFKVYTNFSGKVDLKILASNGVEVNAFDVEVDKGFNYVPFDVTFSEKGRKAYLKKKKNAEVKKAKNDQYYLVKGNYKVEISGIGKTETQEFEVK